MTDNLYKYNGFGMTIGLMRKLLTTNRNWKYIGRVLNIPKPQSDEELKVLSKFVLGYELSLKDFHVDVKLSVDLERKVKISLFNDIDSKLEKPFHGRFEFKDKHSVYYDIKFDNICRDIKGLCLFESLDEMLYKTVFGEYYCGGIGGVAYGQYYIWTILDSYRLFKWFNNRNAGVRDDFKKEIDKLIIENESQER